MNTTRVKYTINPETGQKIKVGTLTWKRLATKYYMIDGAFIDQVISDSRAFTIKKDKERKACKQVVYPAGKKRYIIAGSKSWNERYLEYEWNGHEFGEKRNQPLLKFINTVEKRRETRQNKFFTMFDSKISEGRLSDVINSSLDILSLIIILWMRTCTRNGWMKNERRKTSVSTRMMMKGEYGYIFRTERMKRKWNYWIWWLMRVKSSMKWQRTTSWMKYVIIPSVSSPSWHISSYGHRMGNSRYSISPMID